MKEEQEIVAAIREEFLQLHEFREKDYKPLLETAHSHERNATHKLRKLFIFLRSVKSYLQKTRLNSFGVSDAFVDAVCNEYEQELAKLQTYLGKNTQTVLLRFVVEVHPFFNSFRSLHNQALLIHKATGGLVYNLFCRLFESGECSKEFMDKLDAVCTKQIEDWLNRDQPLFCLDTKSDGVVLVSEQVPWFFSKETQSLIVSYGKLSCFVKKCLSKEESLQLLQKTRVSFDHFCLCDKTVEETVKGKIGKVSAVFFSDICNEVKIKTFLDIVRDKLLFFEFTFRETFLCKESVDRRKALQRVLSKNPTGFVLASRESSFVLLIETKKSPFHFLFTNKAVKELNKMSEDCLIFFELESKTKRRFLLLSKEKEADKKKQFVMRTVYNELQNVLFGLTSQVFDAFNELKELDKNCDLIEFSARVEKRVLDLALSFRLKKEGYSEFFNLVEEINSGRNVENYLKSLNSLF